MNTVVMTNDTNIIQTTYHTFGYFILTVSPQVFTTTILTYRCMFSYFDLGMECGIRF